MSKMNIIDLFAGCGGLLDGFLQSGKYNSVASVEWVKAPVDTLRHRLKTKCGIEDADTTVIRFDMQRVEELFNGFSDEEYGENPGLDKIINERIIDGIIGGVGAVVGFLPLVMVMYFLLALLEDCGYMARVSVVLDPIFKRVGLSGKSVIPFVIGVGCAIPGIMASRTIRDERERRTTAMLTPFMPCGAKIPVISLFAGAFFTGKTWVAPVMYFAGIILILFWAVIIKFITRYKYKKSFFIIELPEYKVPSVIKAALSMVDRGKSYIIKAGTIILVCNALVTIMASFSWSFKLVENSSESILHDIAAPFSILLIPLGFGAWQFAAAAITGFIAKEEVVGTLAAVFAVSENVINSDFELLSGTDFLASVSASGVEITTIAALAYLCFNLFTPPCFAAIGAMNSEMKSAKWVWGGIGLQMATGYAVGFLVYQIGTLVTTGSLGAGFVPGLIVFVAIVAIITYMCINADKKVKAEYALKATN